MSGKTYVKHDINFLILFQEISSGLD